MLNRVVGLEGNDDLEFQTRDDIVTAAAATPCIAPYKRANPAIGDTVPQCHEINDDHLMALGEETDACRMVHAQVFVSSNGRKLKPTGGRLPIVLEYADLQSVIILHKGLKVRVWGCLPGFRCRTTIKLSRKSKERAMSDSAFV